MSPSQKPAKIRTSSIADRKQDSALLVSATWQGPLPAPADLASFNEVIADGAERIFRMAESEQAHRHTIERSMVEMEGNAIRRGHWLGFSVSVLAIGGATATAISGAHWVIPIALVGVPVASIVIALLKR